MTTAILAPMRPIRRARLFAAACAGMASFGVTIVLLGSVFGYPDMAARLNVDVARLGRLASMLLGGVWLATLVVGPLIDRFGNKLVLVASSFIVAASLVGFASAESYAVAAVVCLVLGFGGGGLNVSTNALVSDLYDQTRGSMLNYLGMFFGIGALLLPLLTTQLAGVLTIPQMILAAAVLVGIVGVAFLMLPFPPPREAHGFSLRESLKVVRYPGVMLFALLLFFQTANEQALVTFTTNWLGAAGSTPQFASYALAAYQVGMISGRIIAGALLGNVRKLVVLLGSALAAAAACALIWLGATPMQKGIGVLLAGLCFAPIYPTVLAVAGDRYQRFAGSVFGALFAVALLGGVAAPTVIGTISNSAGIATGPVVPLVGIAIVALLTTVIMARERSR